MTADQTRTDREPPRLSAIENTNAKGEPAKQIAMVAATAIGMSLEMNTFPR